MRSAEPFTDDDIVAEALAGRFPSDFVDRVALLTVIDEVNDR